MGKKEEILRILSGKSNDSSLVPKFESKAEKYSFIFIVFFAVAYVVALIFNKQFTALVFATFSIFFLLIHSVASLINDAPFLKNPVKSYVGSLCVRLNKEDSINKKLTGFSSEDLDATKAILEFEYSRITSYTQFLVGAIEKVGIFPSMLALFYSYHKFQTGKNGNLSYMILGLVIDLYLAVWLIQRVTRWQEWAIYKLSKAAEKHKEK